MGRAYLPYYEHDLDFGPDEDGRDLALDILEELGGRRRNLAKFFDPNPTDKEYSVLPDLKRFEEEVQSLIERGVFGHDGKIINPHQIVSDFVLYQSRDRTLGVGHTFGPLDYTGFAPSISAVSGWDIEGRIERDEPVEHDFLVPCIIAVVNASNFLERLKRAGHADTFPNFVPAEIAHKMMNDRRGGFRH